MKNKVVAIWSPMAREGKTVTAISLAYRLSRLTEDVRLLDLDLKTPMVHEYLNIEDPIHNLDNLMPFVEGRNLNEEIIQLNLVNQDGISLLQGTLRPENAEYYSVSQIQPIIDETSKTASVLLVDVCNQLDNAATCLALQNADIVYVLLEQNILHLKMLNKIFPILKNSFPFANFRFVINKYDKNIALKELNIEHEFGIKISHIIPLIKKDIVNIINMGQYPDEILKDNSKIMREYWTAIEEMALSILKEFDITPKEQEKEKKGLFR